MPPIAEALVPRAAAALIREAAPDYIVDAIDTVSAKVGIIRAAKEMKIPILSSMGTGNKLDPTKLTVTDISKTSICPLARAMRTRLRREGIAHLDVLFSTELPMTPLETEEENGRHLPASTPFVPAAAGLVIAAFVTRKILEI
jgi:tRNA A37 threonylcarbamoyladenosine dehydratase